MEPAEPEADAATLENQTVFHGEQDDGDHDEIAIAFPETKTEIGTTLELLHRLIEETAGANDDATTVPCWLSALFFKGQLAGFLLFSLMASLLAFFLYF